MTVGLSHCNTNKCRKHCSISLLWTWASSVLQNYTYRVRGSTNAKSTINFDYFKGPSFLFIEYNFDAINTKTFMNVTMYSTLLLPEFPNIII